MVPAMAASESWNKAALRELVGDDEAVMHRLLSDYLDSLRNASATLPRAVAAEDAKGVADLAHTLKSSSRWVGAMRLGSLCEAVELAARSGDMGSVSARLPEFEREAATVASAVADYLG